MPVPSSAAVPASPQGSQPSLRVFCLDNSDAAARSEDYFTSRFAYQLEAVLCCSKAVMLPTRAAAAGALQHAPQTYPQDTQVAVVSSGGRPQLTVPSTSDRVTLLATRQLEQRAGVCHFLGGLRLALLTAKRSTKARVTAFLASKAALPINDCSQISKAYADSRVGLDVVVLSPEDTLTKEDRAALDALTAHTTYHTAAASTGSASTSSPALAPVSRGAHSINAAAGNATQQGRSEAVGGSGSSSGSQVPSQLLAILPPPPDPTAHLWRQLEPLMEALQLDTQEDQDVPDLPATLLDRDAAAAAGAAGSTPAAPRPPLPRPPRAGLGPFAVPTGPLQGRSSRGNLQHGSCRYESLDSLQHLSSDGFLRSWLPSYANISKVIFTPPPGSAGDGGSGAPAGKPVPASANNKYCFISVYKLHLPKWHTLMSVQAGCMTECVEAPAAVAAEPAKQQQQVNGGSAAMAAVGGDSTTLAPRCVAAAPPPRLGPSAAAAAALGIARPPHTVPITFSTRCSSAAAAVAAGDAASTSARGLGQRWAVPDLRRGTLSLMSGTGNPYALKLLWSERPAADGVDAAAAGSSCSGGAEEGAGAAQREQQQQQRQASQYTSIFRDDAAERSSGADVDAAELVVTLSAAHSSIRYVEGSNNSVLEVRGATSILRRRPNSGGSGGTPQRDHDDLGSWEHLHRHHQYLHQGPDGGSGSSLSRPAPERLFFWLQQGWEGPGGSSGAQGVAQRMQALMEAPPEYNMGEHSSRARSSNSPMQLGPLPYSLVEQIMRSSGRRLLPDGTVMPACAPAAASSGGAGAGPAGASGGRPVARTAAALLVDELALLAQSSVNLASTRGSALAGALGSHRPQHGATGASGHSSSSFGASGSSTAGAGSSTSGSFQLYRRPSTASHAYANALGAFRSLLPSSGAAPAAAAGSHAASSNSSGAGASAAGVGWATAPAPATLMKPTGNANLQGVGPLTGPSCAAAPAALSGAALAAPGMPVALAPAWLVGRDASGSGPLGLGSALPLQYPQYPARHPSLHHHQNPAAAHPQAGSSSQQHGSGAAAGSSGIDDNDLMLLQSHPLADILSSAGSSEALDDDVMSPLVVHDDASSVEGVGSPDMGALHSETSPALPAADYHNHHHHSNPRDALTSIGLPPPAGSASVTVTQAQAEGAAAGSSEESLLFELD